MINLSEIVSIGSRCCLLLLLGQSNQGCSGKDSTIAQPSTIWGSPCVPFDEALPEFSGNGTEIAMYNDSPSCGGEICVADHFVGRVTCPYGQTADDIQSLPPTDPGRCRVIDSAGNMTEHPVTVAVQPQLVDRRAEKSVYCTCACSGTDSTREYCTCPSDMKCEQLMPVGVSRMGICVRMDSVYDANSVSTLECSRSSTDPRTDCGGNRQNP